MRSFRTGRAPLHVVLRQVVQNHGGLDNENGSLVILDAYGFVLEWENHVDLSWLVESADPRKTLRNKAPRRHSAFRKSSCRKSPAYDMNIVPLLLQAIGSALRPLDNAKTMTQITINRYRKVYTETLEHTETR